MKSVCGEFVSVKEKECALCGLAGELTGEHKIKASLLRSEFGQRKAIIAGKDRPRLLQSPRSKHVHFKRKICKDCNSNLTQAADKAFDKLHEGLKQLLVHGEPLTDLNNEPCVELSPSEQLDIFRYFAKLLCCFLVEVDGPRSKSISEFAIGQSVKNPIFLEILKDTDYQAKLRTNDTQGYAEHGGLKFRFDDNKRLVKSIESSIVAGGIIYIFWVRLNWALGFELSLKYGDLVRQARANIIEG